MGVLEIAVTALVVMGAITGGSAITGAVMGSRREIGALRGFSWGLFLPVVGVGRVWISDRLKQKSNNANVPSNSEVRRTATTAAKAQFAIDNPRKEMNLTPDKEDCKSFQQSAKQQRSKVRGI